MGNYVQIKKGMLGVKSTEGNEVKLPSRVSMGMRNYRYDVDRQILQKKCTNCYEYFDTDQIVDGSFVDIHDEMLIKAHNGKSEMSSRCVKCFDELKEFQVKRDAEKLGILSVRLDVEPQVSAKDSKPEPSKLEGIKLTKENLKYIAHLAVENDVSIDDQINKEVERLRRVNTLKVEYQEKVK